MHEKLQSRGLSVVGVSVDVAVGAAAKLVADLGLTFPNLCDGKAWDSPNFQQLGIARLPATLLIGADGELVALDPSGEQLEDLAEALVSEKKPEPPAPGDGR